MSEQTQAEEKTELTEEQMKEISEIFNDLDKDKSGYLDACEIRRVLCGIGQNPTDDEVSAIIKAAEAKSEREDNRVCLQEFVELIRDSYAVKSEEQEKQEILEAFRVFDQDNNGFITADELYKVLTATTGSKISEADALEMLRLVDKDDDDRISYDEFVEHMMKK